MSATHHRPPRLARYARRACCHAARMGLAVVAVRLASGLVGPAVAAALAVLALTVWAVAWWARVVEPRLCAPHPPATAPTAAESVYRAPVDEAERQLAFARALAVVAVCYLAECEHQARQGGGQR
jgi:hypothetical protein